MECSGNDAWVYWFLTCYSDIFIIFLGGAAAEFRFKDERQWDEDVKTNNISGFFSIDCNNLVSSLECIPLYKRLNLDDTLLKVN